LGRLTSAARLTNSTGIEKRVLDCYALVYMIRGEGWYCNAQGLRTTIKPGHAFLLYPGVQHGYGPTRGQSWDEIFMLFEGPVFDLWRQSGLLDPYKPMYSLYPVAAWEGRIHDIWVDHPPPLTQVSRLQALLAEMVLIRGSAAVGLDHALWLARAKEMLTRTAVDPEGALRTARTLGMSYETFRKRFRKMSGVTPARFRAMRIMEEAAQRLLFENTPIKTIAYELGFCDEFHFSHRFKECLGVSPRAFRHRSPGTSA